MKRLSLFLLLAGCIGCWILGCAPQTGNKPAPAPLAAPDPKPEPEPTNKPVDEPRTKHRFEEWLAQSPMRLTMRSMWISAGMISANAGGFRNTDFDALESNAENIARKAGNFASMWLIIRDANRLMATRAKAGDWFDARLQSQRVWKSCTDCHVETWSMHMRGFMPQSIDGWLKNGNAAEDVPYSGLNLSAPPEFLRAMFTMVALLDRAVTGIDERNSTAVLENTQNIHELVNEQLELWQTVEHHARSIAEIAGKTDTLNIDRHYAKMVKACTTCHEKFVQDEREPLNPLPWKYRER